MTVCIDQLASRDSKSNACRFGAGGGRDAAQAPDGPGCIVLAQPVTLERAEGPGTLSERRINAVLKAIEQSLESGATGEQLAASIGLSRAAFHRAFRATFGTTPFRYMTQRRIEAATALMVETELPLGAIAVQSGFYDQAHLCRHFQKAFGESPRHWRQRHQKRRHRSQVSA